jgi:hypothetical protein
MTRMLCLLLCAASLPAHDLYLMPQKFSAEPGEKLMVSVHSGDAFPASEDGADPARFLEPKLTGAQGAAPVTGFRIAGKATHGFVEIPQAGSFWLSVATKPRLLELAAGKFESYLREEGLDAIVRQRAGSTAAGREKYSKYAKSLVVAGEGPSAFVSSPLGLAIEIVPLADPSRLAPGATLPVRILFRGRPAPDLQVEAAWAPALGKGRHFIAGRTDAEGRIAIPLDKAGRWRLHAVHMQPCPDKNEADWESFWASLTFQLP